jgi:uncharacterized protein YutE (UPF0331/DUF86 family)
MDRELIEQKIESLRRCVERVRQKCPATPAALASDPDAQDILTLNLTRAIQLCVDIGAHLIATADNPAPGTMGQTFDVLTDMGVISGELALRMKKAVGFRNIAVHNYEAINWQIAHLIATRHMQDFTAFAAAVVTSLAP